MDDSTMIEYGPKEWRLGCEAKRINHALIFKGQKHSRDNIIKRDVQSLSIWMRWYKQNPDRSQLQYNAKVYIIRIEILIANCEEYGEIRELLIQYRSELKQWMCEYEHVEDAPPPPKVETQETHYGDTVNLFPEGVSHGLPCNGGETAVMGAEGMVFYEREIIEGGVFIDSPDDSRKGNNIMKTAGRAGRGSHARVAPRHGIQLCTVFERLPDSVKWDRVARSRGVRKRKWLFKKSKKCENK